MNSVGDGSLQRVRRVSSSVLPFHPPGRNADPTPHMDRAPVSRVTREQISDKISSLRLLTPDGGILSSWEPRSPKKQIYITCRSSAHARRTPSRLRTHCGHALFVR